jgi:hypothetical protein
MRRMQVCDTLEPPPPLREAIGLVGASAIGRACGVSYQAVLKWLAAGRMPRTEWTGETRYSEAIERLTEGRVTKTMLLGAWPQPSAAPDDASPVATGEQPRHGQAQLAQEGG